MDPYQLNPEALIVLTKPVPAIVHLSYSHPEDRNVITHSEQEECELEVGTRILFGWGVFANSVVEGGAWTELEPTGNLKKVLDAAKNDPDFSHYTLRIQPDDLLDAFDVLENKVWGPQDMDIKKFRHVMYILDHIGGDPAWLELFPPSVRAEYQEAILQYQSGLCTNNELRNWVWYAIEEYHKTLP